MKVRVRYFALFREQAGCGAETIDWSGGTAAELFTMVAETHPSLQNQAAALVAIVGLLACLVPARRAARIEPMQALRTD